MDKLLEIMKATFEKAKAFLMNMKHKKLILGITAGVLVLAISLVILLSGMQSAPLTPAQQYIKLETDLLHSLINSVPNQSADGAADTTLDIMPSDALLAMFGFEDMDWAKKLTLAIDAGQKGNLQNMLVGVKLNGTDIFSMNMVTDALSGISYLCIPTISDHYLKVDSTTVGDMNDSMTGTASGLMDFLAALNISEMDVAKSILNKYIDIFFSHMTDVEKETQVLTIGGKTQTAEVYTNYITEKVFTDALRAVLNEARNDVALKAALPEDMDLEDIIDEVLDSFTNEPSTDRKDAIVLKLYVDSENRLIGRDMFIGGTEISILTATENGSTALKLTYGGEDLSYELMIDGSGSGTLSMVQPDQSVILANLTYTGDMNKGSCEIKLADFIENLLFQATNIDPALKMDWEVKDDTVDFDLSLSMAGEEMVKIETSSTPKDAPSSITLPGASLDYNNPEEFENYQNNMDLETVRANLLGAGVPEKFVNFVLGAPKK